ncbi:hypothetical protein [Fretibacter rubidus]|uniref:hypothetical protein n=1 Tax=Fretibacter rubidus TaxID=570162 RepID=UPI00352A679D
MRRELSCPLLTALTAFGVAASAMPAYAATTDRPYFRAQSLVIVIGATEDEANGGVAPVAVDFNLLTPASSGTAAPDLIAGDGFVFNSNAGFDPGHDFSGGATRLILEDETSGGNFGNPGGGDIDYLEASDTLTSFGLDNMTDLNLRQSRHVSRFLVVSNAAFDMFAQASNLSTTGDFTSMGYANIGFRALINRSGGSGAGQWGSAAQNPAIGGSGLVTTLNDLGDMSAGPTKIFDGGRRTARFPGTLLEQAVSFNIRYALSGSPDAGIDNDYDFSMGVGTIGADVTYTVYTP